MNLLYIAYSCLPNKGSEEKIGWNVPLESAKYHNVFVVTKEEHRPVIEKYITENNITNPKFYFVDIPQVYKKIYRGFAYSLRLNIWHKKAYPLVKRLCESEKIDIIHQITPIEFRSIGDYYNISDVKFVCGPLGGGEYIPSGLFSYALGNLFVEFARWFLNVTYKIKFVITKQLQKCDYFLFANEETERYINQILKNEKRELYFDNGIDCSDIRKDFKEKSNDKTVFLIAGRMVYRKGQRLLVDAIERLPKDKNCVFRFVGDGPDIKKLKRFVKKRSLQDRVVFTGRIAYSEMMAEYGKADVFIMPSIRETTGAVLLEAASKSVPVIAMKRFGSAVLFDNESAWLYDGKRKNEIIDSLVQVIIECVDNGHIVKDKAAKAKEIATTQTWQRKIEKYNSIYNSLNH